MPVLPAYIRDNDFPKLQKQSAGPQLEEVAAETTPSWLNSTRNNLSCHDEGMMNKELVLMNGTSAPIFKNIFITVKENRDLINENERIGILFSSKAIVQLLVNPLVAVALNR